MKLFVLTLSLAAFLVGSTPATFAASETRFWEVQAVDTMKYSRDVAREKLNNKAYDVVIERQVKAIADMGATHVAIGVPYDAEFLPFLKRWVASARAHNLSIWFRGNWSGWEGWFEYKKITREEHFSKTESFIAANRSLFQDGDIFVACPECENGGPGDPRMNGDLKGHREFLIKEHDMMVEAFKKIGKNVDVRFNSMNGDVARLVMDKKTTSKLGGIVAIDHYVKTPEKLAKDIADIAKNSGGKVVLGEWGVPIPDIHGPLTPAQQASWTSKSLEFFMNLSDLSGMNWWVNVGGSTALFNDNGTARPAVAEIAKYWKPATLSGVVQDPFGQKIKSATVEYSGRSTVTGADGTFQMAYPQGVKPNLSLKANKMNERSLSVDHPERPQVIIMGPAKLGFLGKMQAWASALIGLYK